jgi:hypothetical protein
MATSAVPGAIAALLAILQAAPGLAGVQVLDGPPTGDMSGQDYLAVGWDGDTGANAADASQQFNAAGARTRDEDFSVACWLNTWTGDPDIAARRVRAYGLLAVVEDAVRASGASPMAPTLGGAVLWAHLTAHSLRQDFTSQGARAAIGFTITCRARI